MKLRHHCSSLSAFAVASLLSASLSAQPTAAKTEAPAASAPATQVKPRPVQPAPAPTTLVPPTSKPGKPAPSTPAPAKAEPKPKSPATASAVSAETVPAKADDKAAKPTTDAAAGTTAEGEQLIAAEGDASAVKATPGAPASKAASADTADASVSAAETPPAEAAPKGPLAPLSSFMRVYLSVASVWNKDPGYDLFSKDDVGQRIGLQVDFDVLDLTDSVTLALEAGIAGEADSDGRTPSGLASEGSLGSTHLFGGVVGRVETLSFLELHARGVGGVSFTQLELSGVGSGLSEDVTSPLFGVGAGFSVLTEPRRLDPHRKHFNSIAFGLRLEGGYLVSSKVSMAFPDEQVDVPEQRLRVQGASLGSLDRSGVYFDVAGFLSF